MKASTTFLFSSIIIGKVWLYIRKSIGAPIHPTTGMTPKTAIITKSIAAAKTRWNFFMLVRMWENLNFLPMTASRQTTVSIIRFTKEISWLSKNPSGPPEVLKLYDELELDW